MALQTANEDPLELANEYLALSRRWRTNDVPLDDDELVRLRFLRSQLQTTLSGKEAEASRVSRRDWLRVPAKLGVDLAEGDDERGWLTEISGGGVFIASDHPLPVGSDLSFQIVLEKGPPIRVGGIVRWSRAAAQAGSAEEPPGMGVQFNVLDDETHERVMGIIEEALYLSLSA